jgi:hypothetical protein
VAVQVERVLATVRVVHLQQRMDTACVSAQASRLRDP